MTIKEQLYAKIERINDETMLAQWLKELDKLQEKQAKTLQKEEAHTPRNIVEHMIHHSAGANATSMTTDEIMQMTRGE